MCENCNKQAQLGALVEMAWIPKANGTKTLRIVKDLTPLEADEYLSAHPCVTEQSEVQQDEAVTEGQSEEKSEFEADFKHIRRMAASLKAFAEALRANGYTTHVIEGVLDGYYAAQCRRFAEYGEFTFPAEL